MAEEVDGVALEAGPDVGVDGGGDADVGESRYKLEVTVKRTARGTGA
ncbi:hypothetical protein GCM10010319_47700 [Streptomyces blastmyceticus]|uniref:Uncharacterized protein n=1 Tax=Streptomyces blastmyceticus TaxID=68180 RepID=A0ABN0XHG1_9ACTN